MFGKFLGLIVLLVGVTIPIVMNPDIFGEKYGPHIRNAIASQKVWFWMKVLVPEESIPHLDALKNVLENGRKGDSAHILKIMDDHAWKGNFMIQVGDVKGKIVRNALHAAISAAGQNHFAGGDKEEPYRIVEFGTLAGYGTLALQTELEAIGFTNYEIITVDPATISAATAGAIFNHANLPFKSGRSYKQSSDALDKQYKQKSPRVHQLNGYSDALLAELKKMGKKIDFLFIDHVKHLYLADLQYCLENDLFSDKAVFVGDNIIYPGAPEYKRWLLENEGKKMTAKKGFSYMMKSKVHSTHVEYWPSVPDEVIVTEYVKISK